MFYLQTNCSRTFFFPSKYRGQRHLGFDEKKKLQYHQIQSARDDWQDEKKAPEGNNGIGKVRAKKQNWKGKLEKMDLTMAQRPLRIINRQRRIGKNAQI